MLMQSRLQPKSCELISRNAAVYSHLLGDSTVNCCTYSLEICAFCVFFVCVNMQQQLSTQYSVLSVFASL